MKYWYFVSYIASFPLKGYTATGRTEIRLDNNIESIRDIVSMENSLRETKECEGAQLSITNYQFLRGEDTV